MHGELTKLNAWRAFVEQFVLLEYCSRSAPWWLDLSIMWLLTSALFSCLEQKRWNNQRLALV